MSGLRSDHRAIIFILNALEGIPAFDLEERFKLALDIAGEGEAATALGALLELKPGELRGLMTRAHVGIRTLDPGGWHAAITQAQRAIRLTSVVNAADAWEWVEQYGDE